MLASKKTSESEKNSCIDCENKYSQITFPAGGHAQLAPKSRQKGGELRPDETVNKKDLAITTGQVLLYLVGAAGIEPATTAV
jgi:hypothetical protein